MVHIFKGNGEKDKNTKEKVKMKRNNGVTLVALILTIIIIIILAAIAISSSKNGGGLIKRSQDSVTKLSVSELNDRIELAKSNLTRRNLDEPYSIDELADELRNEDTDVTFKSEDNDKASWIIENQEYEFKEEKDGTITYENKGEVSQKEIDDLKKDSKNILKNIPGKAIKFSYSTDWTNNDVPVTVSKDYDQISDETLRQLASNNNFHIEATLNDTSKFKQQTEVTATARGDVVYARLTDGQGNHGVTVKEKINNIDKMKPSSVAPTATSTTSTITVTSKQTDIGGSGIKTVEYSKDGGNNWQETNVFTSLAQNVTYTVETRTTDGAGNKTTSKTINVTTGKIPSVQTASLSTTEWTNQDVTVTLPISDGFTTVYTTDGKDPTATSKEYGGQFAVGENCKIKYAYSDGTNMSSIGNIDVSNIDKISPTKDAPRVETTTNSISITSSQIDEGGSGIKSTEFSIDDGATWQTTSSYRNLSQNTSYKVRTRTTDNAGNVSESEPTTVSTKKIGAVGTAILNPSTWTNKNVTVTLPIADGLTTVYTIDGKAPTKNSQKYIEPFIVSENCTIMFIYTDGTNINTAGTVKVEKIDRTEPTTDAPTETHTTNTITVTSNQKDVAGTNEQASGIKTVQYSKDGGATWQDSNTFTGLTQTTKQY